MSMMYKDWPPNRATAEAVLALCQLIQLRNFRPLIEKLKPLYGIKEGGDE